MKKSIKIILTIIGFLIGTILLDTIQARIFKHSPFISWKESLPDDDSYVDKGILMDTYYCTEEKDIVTVSWHFKYSKYTCPIDNEIINNDIELNESEDITMTIKDGTLTKSGATIIITDVSGKNNVYGTPYRIDKLENGTWKELDVVVKGNYGWTSIGYYVGEDNKLELDINWEWLYGKLEPGTYRLVKNTAKNKYYFSVEFTIE